MKLLAGIRTSLSLAAAVLLIGPAVGVGHDAHALTTLKKVQVTDGSQIDLLFDEKVSPSQIKTEFLRDIVQISLNNVSVYPAKINSVAGMDLTKVFAYQYTPKLVRCRLTVKGKAEEYKDRIKIDVKGKVVSVRIVDAKVSDKIVNSAASAARDADSGEDARGSAMDRGEQELLNRIQGKDKSGNPESSKDADQIRLGGAKPLPSPLKAFGVMGGLLALLILMMFVVKKARGNSIQNHKGLGGLVSKLGGFASMGIKSRNKMIEVLSSHHLGPKKSISVVKIGGKILVLGVTEENINLITQLSSGNPEELMSANLDLLEKELGISEPELTGVEAPEQSPARQQSTRIAKAASAATVAGSGATSAGKPVFSDILATESSKPSVRAQIRSRLEGLKQL